MAGYSLLTTLTLSAAGFNKGIDQVSKKVSSFKKGTSEAARSISSSFQSMSGLLGGAVNSEIAGIGEAIMGGVKSFKLMIPAINGVKAALISSGIGAIVVALGLAFSGLVTWMKRTEEGSDTLSKVFLFVKSLINTILNQLALLGSAIVKLFKGDFKGAAEDATQAVMGFGDEMRENVKAAKDQFEAEERLESFMIEYGMKRAQLEQRISELREQASEADNPEEKVKYISEAKKLTDEMYALDITKSQLELDIINQKYAQQEKTSSILQEISNKESEIYKIKAAQSNEQRALNKQYIAATNEIKNQIEAERQLQREKEKASSGTLRSSTKPIEGGQVTTDYQISVPNNPVPVMMQRNTEVVSAFTDKFSTAMENLQGTLTNFFEKFGEGIKIGFDIAFQALAVWDEALEAAKANELKLAEGNRAKQEEIEKKYAKKRKKLMLAQAIATGAVAVISALTTQPIWVGIVMAALTAAMVGFQIAKINATQFATGGIVPGTSYSGDKVTARVNSGEMILNGSQQARLFAMANGGGVGGREVVFRIEGTQLVGVLNNYNKRTMKIA
jgi:hypothetical protein